MEVIVVCADADNITPHTSIAKRIFFILFKFTKKTPIVCQSFCGIIK